MKTLFLWFGLLVAIVQPLLASDVMEEVRCPGCKAPVRILRPSQDTPPSNQSWFQYITKRMTQLVLFPFYIPSIITSLNGSFQNFTSKLQDARLQANLKDLVSNRFNKDLIRSGNKYIFSGINGPFYNACGQRSIQPHIPVSSLFLSKDTEILRLTNYEMLEIFLDCIFGLHPDEGAPPPKQREGNLVTLLRCKLDFTIGTARDGRGQSYGRSKTPDHFADCARSTGRFGDLSAGGSVVEYFKAHKAETDYERLVVLFKILTTARTV